MSNNAPQLQDIARTLDRLVDVLNNRQQVRRDSSDALENLVSAVEGIRDQLEGWPRDENGVPLIRIVTAPAIDGPPPVPAAPGPRDSRPRKGRRGA